MEYDEIDKEIDKEDSEREVADFLKSYLLHDILTIRTDALKSIDIKAQTPRSYSHYGYTYVPDLEDDFEDIYFVLPMADCSRDADLLQKANFKAYIKLFGDIGVYGSGGECRIDATSLVTIADDKWEDFYDTVDGVTSNYPVLDDDLYQRLQDEESTKAWDNWYRREFRSEIGKKCELRSEDGFRGGQFEEILDSNDELDALLAFLEEKYDRLEWSPDNEGSMDADLHYFLKNVDEADILEFLVSKIPFPPGQDDPRQLSFADYRNRLQADVNMANESDMAKRIVGRLLEDKLHSYSCALLKLPEEIAEKIVAWGKLQINEEDIFVDKKGSKGREDDPHVTIVGGIDESRPNDTLLQLLSKTAPIEIKLGPCSLFKKKDYDVVKMAVTSPFLHSLHEEMEKVVNFTSKFDEYIPHVTLAYVKPGTCDRLEGASPWDDVEKFGVSAVDEKGLFTADTVLFSASSGKVTEHKLKKAVVGESCHFHKVRNKRHRYWNG